MMHWRRYPYYDTEVRVTLIQKTSINCLMLRWICQCVITKCKFHNWEINVDILFCMCTFYLMYLAYEEKKLMKENVKHWLRCCKLFFLLLKCLIGYSFHRQTSAFFALQTNIQSWRIPQKSQRIMRFVTKAIYYFIFQPFIQPTLLAFYSWLNLLAGLSCCADWWEELLIFQGVRVLSWVDNLIFLLLSILSPWLASVVDLRIEKIQSAWHEQMFALIYW